MGSEQPSLKIHQRLTEDHFTLGYASRMRIHLAVNLLNDRMLELMQVFLKTVISINNA